MIWTADLPTTQKPLTSSHLGVACTVSYPLSSMEVEFNSRALISELPPNIQGLSLKWDLGLSGQRVDDVLLCYTLPVVHWAVDSQAPKSQDRFYLSALRFSQTYIFSPGHNPQY